jgi:predicted AAA+ superfamily ATPase
MQNFGYTRNYYLKKIAPFMNKPVIKVITGMRRIGKSYFVRQLIARLLQSGITEQQVVYINKELIEFDFIKNYADLHLYINGKFAEISGKKYLFIDEIQEIDQWEKTISSLLASEDIDIYITGSNAHLLSSEIATLISGRYIEFPIYALSFDEFLLFRGEEKEDVDTEFLKFLKFGGFPAIHHFELNEEIIYQYINSIYNTILLKDVVARNNIRNVQLLENVTQYIFHNIGNIFSAKKVADFIKTQKLQIGVDTVQNYLSFLLSSFMIFKVPRFDIKGKRLLEVYEKYYLGNIGLRHALLGYRESDISGILENIVFLELKRRGYKVFVGKYEDYEIDFIAEKEKEKIYLQVTYLLSSPLVIEREFSALQRINDNYPKYVISMDKAFGEDFEGIRRMNIIDFLLTKE